MTTFARNAQNLKAFQCIQRCVFSQVFSCSANRNPVFAFTLDNLWDVHATVIQNELDGQLFPSRLHTKVANIESFFH
jgi:hypothetical protein